MEDYKVGEYYHGYLFERWYFITIIYVDRSGIKISLENTGRISGLISRNNQFRHEFDIRFVNNKRLFATFVKLIEDE